MPLCWLEHWSATIVQCCCLTLLCPSFIYGASLHFLLHNIVGVHGSFCHCSCLPVFFLHQSGTQHIDKTTQWPTANIVLVSCLQPNQYWHRRPSSSYIRYGNPKNRCKKPEHVLWGLSYVLHASALDFVPDLVSYQCVWAANSSVKIERWSFELSSVFFSKEN